MKTSLKVGLLLALAAGVAVAHAAGLDVRSLISPEVGAGLMGLGAFGTTKYSHSGDAIDWTNGTGADVVSGQVVKMGAVLGVALVDIKAAATGAVGFGVFRDLPKVAGTGAMAVGDKLLWDVSAGKFDVAGAAPAAGDVSGAPAFVAAAALTGDALVTVCLTGVPGTVT
jgi:predicted RecA/RadA family phage recombinase